jgi:hypothetical protein
MMHHADYIYLQRVVLTDGVHHVVAASPTAQSCLVRDARA